MKLHSRSPNLPPVRQRRMKMMATAWVSMEKASYLRRRRSGRAGLAMPLRAFGKQALEHEGDGDCIWVQTINLDSDEADDDIDVAPAVTGKAFQQSQAPLEVVKVPVHARPRGRLWLDHVEIPNSNPSTRPEQQTPASRSQLEQSRLDGHVTVRDESNDISSANSQNPTVAQPSSVMPGEDELPSGSPTLPSRRSLRSSTIAARLRSGPSKEQSTSDTDEWQAPDEDDSSSDEDYVSDDEKARGSATRPSVRYRARMRKRHQQAKATAAKSTEAKPTQAKPTQAKTTQAKTTQAKTTQAKSTPAKSTQAKPTQAKSTQAASKGKAPASTVYVPKLDKFNYKLGINLGLPPMHRLEDIFDDMTAKSVPRGLDKAIKHLRGRPLKVATLCSGTESPLLALGLVRESLAKHFNLTLEIEHLFSAEIDAFKQAYIERNFSPPIIFRDVKEFTRGAEATTAYGAKVPVPGGADLLVAGCSCVDFSALNNARRSLDQVGESGDTFRATLHYVDKYRPKIVILENVRGADWKRKAGFFREVNYAAEWVIVDTKRFYIPHTRLRGYLVAIDKAQSAGTHGLSSDKIEAMAMEWKGLVKSLERPASSSLEAFMLDEDDPRVHRGREEMSRNAADDKPATSHDWYECQVRHHEVRRDQGLGVKRPMTGWEEGGTCKLPDYTWQNWAAGQVERVWDLLDISVLRSAKKGYDVEYKTRPLELSQNVDRFTDGTPFGVAACVTPTGLFYLTNRGGPLIGLETLALQGLPIERLLLTRESQKELRNLAGNAMSSTVVGAGIIAALIAAHQVLEMGDGHSTAVKRVERVPDWIRHDRRMIERKLDVAGFDRVPTETILSAARHSVRLCVCEGRAAVTSRNLQRCELCGHTSCLRCGGNPKHQYRLLGAEEVGSRIRPASFQDMLKWAVPMTMTLGGLTMETVETFKKIHGANKGGKDWGLLEDALRPVVGAEFRFHSLKRAQVWTASYESESAKLELVLDPTRAEWRLFAKPARTEPGNARARQLLARPVARMRPTGQGLLAGRWQFCLPIDDTFPIQIEGCGEPVRSWESMIGLQGSPYADKRVCPKLRVQVPNEFRPLVDLDIGGEYELLQNCGTASGCLHKRQSNDAVPVFLFLDPTPLGESKDDTFVFATDTRRLNYGETRLTLAQLDASWRTSGKTVVESVQCRVVGRWVQWPEAHLQPAVQATKAGFAVPPTDFNIDCHSHSCEQACTILDCAVALSETGTMGWQKGPWQIVDRVDEREFFSAFAWLIERVCRAPPLEAWRVLTLPEDFRNCDRCAPTRPPLRWELRQHKLSPYEDPQGAGVYERTLRDRPPLFVTQRRIDEDNIGRLEVGLNIVSLVHRAMATLASGGTLVSGGFYGNFATSWRLITDHDASSRPRRPKFTLQSNRDDSPSAQPPNFRVELRPEQLRSLTWMRERESAEAPAFLEEEVEEALLPSLGWRAEAKATRPVFVRGGVLADQVGYGKTAITLDLIDVKAQETATDQLTDTPGKIAIKASLIVVPSHLVSQWKSEVEKFLGDRYHVMTIRTMADLNRSTIKDFEEADIVIVSWSLLQNDRYLARLAAFAALPESPAPNGRAFDAWFEFAARRLRDSVEQLRTDSINVHDYLTSLLDATENDENLKQFIPSRRLRGAQYLAAQLAEQDGSAQLAQEEASAQLAQDEGSAQLAEEEAIAIEEEEELEHPPSAGGTTAVLRADPFYLGTDTVKRDWRRMSCPLLHLFRFARLVIDEYTYVKGKSHTSVNNLQADARWALSGTPPLDDFADVKTIAVFLGVHLGVDDYTRAVLQAQNVRALELDHTDVERFQAYQQSRSSSWHQRRHEVAQMFLDHLVRQNMAELDEIPYQERLCLSVLPAAERAIYMEMSHTMVTQEMRKRKVKAANDNDRERRLAEALGKSQSAEEALLKCCSQFTLNAVETDTDGTDGAEGACSVVVKTRKDQYDRLVLDLRRYLKMAFEFGEGEAGASHFASWLQNAGTNEFGDLEATAVLTELIESVKGESAGRGRVASGESDAKGQPSGRRSVAGQKRKRAPSADSVGSAVGDSDGPDTSDELDPDADDKDAAPPEPKTLRETASYLRRLSLELVSRLRSLRFFKVVRRLQLAQSAASSSTGQDTCSKCNRVDVPVKTLSILTQCGHTACDSCLAEATESKECVVAGCRALAHEYRIVKATELGEQDGEVTPGPIYGRKMKDIMELISKEIPRDEQVILFVQFDSRISDVEAALEAYDISYAALRTGKRALASKVIADFQNNTGPDKKKVLVLNPADESASGANLTNANHVIFLSPLFTQTQYQYESSMVQAIGRARRYGQEKVVCIYHCMALKTIDVDIFEDRKGGRLVPDGNEYVLRDANELDLKTVERAGSGELRRRRDDFYDDY